MSGKEWNEDGMRRANQKEAVHGDGAEKTESIGEQLKLMGQLSERGENGDMYDHCRFEG